MLISKIGYANSYSNTKKMSSPTFTCIYASERMVDGAVYAIKKYGKMNLENCTCEQLKDCINSTYVLGTFKLVAPGSINYQCARLLSEARSILAKKEAIKKSLNL